MEIVIGSAKQSPSVQCEGHASAVLMM